jgi:hypothetical protein
MNGLDQDDLYSAATIYERAMGYSLDDESRTADRWLDVFNRTWTRQARQARKRGTGFVLCEVFDIAMRAAGMGVVPGLILVTVSS